ncbi:MAG: PglZ domain-containing protein [Chitinophagales bacterium]|nr:PglZ domain-containing protein [Chitinophagales bacterium]|tara:strand:- start:10880 stop:12433 length:1554 start_codon:yes stop_codon:yes gene_type:complete
MSKIRILWADDEIDLLKPQIMFLENKGYEIIPVTNGQDAIDKVKEEDVDVVFLDESMPGLSGLETLPKIKEIKQHLPVVMITKNEEEDLMEEAIGSQITDYLIKPVKSQQILLTLKKIVDNKRLVKEKTQSNYQQEFQRLFMRMQDHLDYNEWADLYKKLVFWELELEKSNTYEMAEILASQKTEANREFCKYVSKNYLDWFGEDEDKPLLSHNLFKERVFDLLKEDKPTYFILIDNLRYDQWKMLEPSLLDNFKVQNEEMFYSILPTATQYARNAIFSGLTPLQIQEHYPNYWKNDEEDGGKNLYEEELVKALIKRNFKDDLKISYTKVTNFEKGKDLEDKILNGMNNRLNVIVYNFVDTISHAKTEMDMIKELASDDSAFRSLTLSWFEHSPLQNAIQKLANKDVNIVITTDHGTKLVAHPSKCIGDRDTTSNIRYKTGKSLAFDSRDVFEIKNPKDAQLPSSRLSSSYIFAKDDNYLIYQNNYNKFATYFKDTFQHGGLSLEEMIIPFVILKSK